MAIFTVQNGSTIEGFAKAMTSKETLSVVIEGKIVKVHLQECQKEDGSGKKFNFTGSIAESNLETLPEKTPISGFMSYYKADKPSSGYLKTK